MAIIAPVLMRGKHVMISQLLALVVETNYLIASAIELPLTESGYRVVIATTDIEALEALSSHHIDVAIIDFRLQHGAADGLVARLSAAGIPYIFCTAASPQEVDEHFPQARVIEKPFLDDALVSVVSELVGTWQNSAHS